MSTKKTGIDQAADPRSRRHPQRDRSDRDRGRAGRPAHPRVAADRRLVQAAGRRHRCLCRALRAAGGAAAAGSAAAAPTSAKNAVHLADGRHRLYLAGARRASRSSRSAQQVSEGQTLLIIEAMKTMNQIPAPRAGTVTRDPVRGRPARSNMASRWSSSNRAEPRHVPENPHRQPRRDRPSRAARLQGARHRRPSRSIRPPTPTPCMCGLPTRASASARRRRAIAISTSTRSSPPARSPAPTRCIRATASCRRTPSSPTSWPRTSITFIGPSAEHIRIMGDKIEAKRTAKRLGIPVVPGSDGAMSDDAGGAPQSPREIGYPGHRQGGGRRRRARHEGRAQAADDLSSALATARAEAGAAFGDDAVYIEKYLGKPRHIEVQVIGDGAGNAVHLGERDCSLQRRHQKVWEEAPSPALNAERAHAASARSVADAIAELGYSGAGTVEFLYENGEFYFIEMNTRLQVEHPVTEAITGIDLVHEQIRVASGGGLSVDAGGHPLPRPRHRMPHQCRGPAHLRALARHDHPFPYAGRPRRARRFRRLFRLPDPALLRQPDRQADRAWPQPRRMHDAAAPRARRVRRRRHQDDAAAVPRSRRQSPTSPMATTTSTGWKSTWPSRPSAIGCLCT